MILLTVTRQDGPVTPTDAPAEPPVRPEQAPPRVAVVGSVNLDLVARVRAFPRGGETVLGSDYDEVPGGKGLNQALGAVRHGATSLVAVVGDDPVGDRVVAHAAARGTDVEGVGRASGLTGRALVTVEPDGENVIVVAPLANAALDAGHVRAQLDRVRPDVVLAQHEVRVEALREAAAWCDEHGARFAFNASPVHDVPADLVAVADPLLVNQPEGLALLRAASGAGPGASAWRPADVARALLARARSVVVTAGGAGAVVADADGVETVATGRRVVAVDTTGAGDEFAGVLAARLATGAGLRDAARAADEAASALVQVPRDER